MAPPAIYVNEGKAATSDGGKTPTAHGKEAGPKHVEVLLEGDGMGI